MIIKNKATIIARMNLRVKRLYLLKNELFFY